MTATLHINNADFGKYVDYSLLTVNTDYSFTQFVTAISEYCHCDFHSSDDYIPTTALSNLEAQFKTAFTQFNCQGRDKQFAYTSVDKLNIFIIDNQTKKFNHHKIKSSPSKSKSNSNDLTLFPETNNGTCYILNKKGLYIKKWPYANVNFLVLIFSKKQHGVDKLTEHLLLNKKFCIGNLTDYLYGKKKNKKGEWELQKNISTPVKLLRALFTFAEQRIKNHSENGASNSIGKKPVFGLPILNTPNTSYLNNYKKI